MNNFSSGEIMNLLANDANKIELAHYFLNYLWVCNEENLKFISENRNQLLNNINF